MLRFCVMMHSFCTVMPNKSRSFTVFIKSVLPRETYFTQECNVIPYCTNISEISSQNKPWKRIKKNDPALKTILQSPEAKAHISVLAKVMDCDEAQVTELVKRDSVLIASDAFLEKLELVKSHGFSIQEVLANPAVLHRSLSVLKERLGILKTLQSSDSITLRALKLTDQAFQAYVQKHLADVKILQGYPSRMSFIACLLDCNEKEAATFASEHQFLWTMSPALIKSKVDALVKHRVSQRFIRENMRILVHASEHELVRRLVLLQEKDSMQTIQCKLQYLLSCRREDFSKSFSYFCKVKDALEGCTNRVEYLMFRLNCDENTAKNLVIFRPISTISNVKLKQCLDFFLNDVQVKPEFMMNNKGLFNFSVKTLRERWRVLQSAGYNDTNISNLAKAFTMSNQKFQRKFGSCVFIDTFNNPG